MRRARVLAIAFFWSMVVLCAVSVAAVGAGLGILVSWSGHDPTQELATVGAALFWLGCLAGVPCVLILWWLIGHGAGTPAGLRWAKDALELPRDYVRNPTLVQRFGAYMKQPGTWAGLNRPQRVVIVAGCVLLSLVLLNSRDWYRTSGDEFFWGTVAPLVCLVGAMLIVFAKEKGHPDAGR